MRVVFLTTDDPLYLPDFFERVLPAIDSRSSAVCVVPPLYKGQSSLQAAWRYARTFGFVDALRLVRQVVAAKLRRRSIETVCERYGVAYREATDVNDEAFLGELRAGEPDLLVSVSCPQIFRKPLIELAPRGCLNIHGALLPQYRGVMPSFWMLANGEPRAGVSIYFVNEAIDAGELCAQEAFDVAPDETLDSFLRRSKALAADLLVDVLPRIEDGTATRTALDLDRGSYYSWPDRGAVTRFRERGRRLW